MTEEYPIVYIYHIFIHSSVDGHLGWIHILEIVTNAALNTGVPYSQMFWVMTLICFDRFCSLKSDRFIGTLNWLNKSIELKELERFELKLHLTEASLLQY